MIKRTVAILTAALMLAASVAAFGLTSNAAYGYVDVQEGAWFDEGVEFCASHGYMNGTAEGVFSPGDKVTRAMFVLVMAKMAGAPLDDYTESAFTDVPEGAWYTAAVEWARDMGLAGGVGNGLFAPGEVLTREQAATFLAALARFTGNDADEGGTLECFADRSCVSAWAEETLGWAVWVGLISGVRYDEVSPRTDCTRAQLALMVMKYFDYYSGCVHVWSAPSCTEGRQCLICGYRAGTPLGHDSGADCTHDGVCARCGETVAAYGHTASPTCTEGAVCVRCGETLPALGHRNSGGHCVRCGVATTAKNYEIIRRDGAYYVLVGGEEVLIANKSYALSPSYAPGGLTDEAYDAFGRMRDDAASMGMTILIRSGYRSYSHQQSLYNNYCARDGKAMADRYSARPGHSEHQTGLAMDVNSLEQGFGNTREGRWVAAHCYEYGFIIRYPEGKESITGYMYEPWHVRYLGALAADVYRSGLTLEEYLGVDSHY